MEQLSVKKYLENGCTMPGRAPGHSNCRLRDHRSSGIGCWEGEHDVAGDEEADGEIEEETPGDGDGSSRQTGARPCTGASRARCSKATVWCGSARVVVWWPENTGAAARKDVMRGGGRLGLGLRCAMAIETAGKGSIRFGNEGCAGPT